MSLRSNEGYLLIDHRNSPGVPDQVMVSQGLSPGAGQGLFEAATVTCPYCERVGIIDHHHRWAFDKKTTHLMCDTCEYKIKVLGMQLKTMKQIADELRNIAAKRPNNETFQSPVICVGVK